jgi:uncharacterized membrane protein YidH (DUF202 family)
MTEMKEKLIATVIVVVGVGLVMLGLAKYDRHQAIKQCKATQARGEQYIYVPPQYSSTLHSYGRVVKDCDTLR